jgi:hypothetical protein
MSRTVLVDNCHTTVHGGASVMAAFKAQKSALMHVYSVFVAIKSSVISFMLRMLVLGEWPQELLCCPVSAGVQSVSSITCRRCS